MNNEKQYDLEKANSQIEEILNKVKTELEDKFWTGQETYKTNFFKVPCLRHAREEALDLINYTHVIEVHQQELIHKANDLIQSLVNLRMLSDVGSINTSHIDSIIGMAKQALELAINL